MSRMSEKRASEPRVKVLNAPKKDGRISCIIHFDYDCFYASVFEQENPALKSLPLGVQQKQILVTVNYEARARGLRKLMLITEAKEICPDVVIVLGEELNRFRDASKALYFFLKAFTWSGKVERLGFDEVFMDVSDIVEANLALVNPNDLSHSFFVTSRDDPAVGFSFDATQIAGHGYPATLAEGASISSSMGYSHNADPLKMALILGSHFARHLRLSLEEQKGYTSTVGISTNKLLSKLVGNVNKPKAQTTLLPPYETGQDGQESNITAFMDSHDIGKVPGIGFKIANKIRNHVLSRPADFDTGLIYGETKEAVRVRDVRLFLGMGAETLESILGGPGAERGIGGKIWGLINGVDTTEVKEMRKVPTQISIEDSYMRLDSMAQVMKELRILATSLIKRMHTDLLEDDEDQNSGITKRWTAHPKTIRLSTRPRPPPNADGTRTRSFNRISRSCPLPTFVFSLKDDIDSIVEKLIQKTLLALFRQLHPQKGGWNLSLINIGVTNMVESATEDSSGQGRDIGRMFKRQEDVLKEWKIEDRDVPPSGSTPKVGAQSPSEPDEILAERSARSEAYKDQIMAGSEDDIYPTQNTVDQNGYWEEEEEDDEHYERCQECGAVMPVFAMAAHERFHNLKE